MKVTHHLDDATIVAYAAGTLGEAHSVVVAAHLAYCNHCRSTVRTAEAIGGELIASHDSVAVSDTCRAATLASLGEIAPQPKGVRPAMHEGMPAPLSHVLGGKSFAELPWRNLGMGVAKYEIPLADSGKSHLMLLRIAPGRAMPEHGHGGEEITLVLSGSYSDHTGRYQAGDVADLDEEIEHTPRVDSDVDCICLVATEAPTRFKSIWARIAQPFIGI